MKIGMIGLGAMGFPITKCLLKAGFEVYAFDVAEKALDEAAANGAHPCPDVAKVGAEAETILCSLPNAAIVESVMQEALAGEELKAKVWIDLSIHRYDNVYGRKFVQQFAILRLLHVNPIELFYQPNCVLVDLRHSLRASGVTFKYIGGHPR